MPPRSAAAPSSTEGTVHATSHSQSGAPVCSQEGGCVSGPRKVCRDAATTVLQAAALCLRGASGGGGVWFDAVVLVGDDERRFGGERHAHRRAAAVALHVD